MKLRALPLVALAFATLFAVPAAAQAPYPSRPIKLLVPIPPGGAPDTSARLVAQFLQETRGWSVVIENRTGANGNIAAAEAAKAAPDGYTLLLGADSGITINPHVYGKLRFDPLKDLLPVTTIATNQFMLSVNPGCRQGRSRNSSTTPARPSRRSLMPPGAMAASTSS
jgi:tripartite-type tricarboxylate transporter receptor subunit TctC